MVEEEKGVVFKVVIKVVFVVVEEVVFKVVFGVVVVVDSAQTRMSVLRSFFEKASIDAVSARMSNIKEYSRGTRFNKANRRTHLRFSFGVNAMMQKVAGPNSTKSSVSARSASENIPMIFYLTIITVLNSPEESTPSPARIRTISSSGSVCNFKPYFADIKRLMAFSSRGESSLPETMNSYNPPRQLRPQRG